MHNGIIVIDLEATCWADDSPMKPRQRAESEVIEIGAVYLDADGLGPEFTRVIKPVIHPELTEFCTQLTTITQEEVDAADEYGKVWYEFLAWADQFPEGTRLASWGKYDHNQFKREALRDTRRRLHNPWHSNASHVNLKEVFAAQMKRLGRPFRRKGLSRAVQAAGLTFEGTAHRALPDARMAARVTEWVVHPDRYSDTLKAVIARAEDRPLDRRELKQFLKARNCPFPALEKEMRDVFFEGGRLYRPSADSLNQLFK